MKDKFYTFFGLVSRYAFYGLLFFVPISISLIEIFAVLMLLAFIGRKIIKPDFKFLRSQPNIFLLLFLFFMALSLYNSAPYLYGSFRTLSGKWMKYIVICFAVQDILNDHKMIKHSVVIILFTSALVVLSGLTQYFFGMEFLRNKSMAVMDCGWRAATSSFAHYNSFAAYLVPVLSLTAALLLADDCYGLKAVGLLILSVFSTFAIMLTFSRGSWIALTASFIVVFIFGRRKLERLIPIFLIVVAISFLPEIRERLYFAFSVGGDTNRFKYWSAAFKMISSHPFFGMGVGTFMVNFSKYSQGMGISYAHNCYLQIWAESGIFSLASFTAFIASFVYLGVRKFIASRDFLLLGLLAGIIGFLIHSFFDVNLYSLQLAVLFWIWCGLLISRIGTT